jgi:hypothetical protein
MKTKTKRKCKNKKSTRRRKIYGGEVQTLKEAYEEVGKKRELLRNPNIQNQLSEAKAKKPLSFNDFIMNNAQKFVDAYIKYIESSNPTLIASQMSNQLGKELIGQVGNQLTNQIGNQASQFTNQIGNQASQFTNPIGNQASQFTNQIGEQTSSATQMKSKNEITINPSAEMINTKITGGGNSKNKVISPMFPLIRKKEANIIGGRIETSIKHFLG